MVKAKEQWLFSSYKDYTIAVSRRYISVKKNSSLVPARIEGNDDDIKISE